MESNGYKPNRIKRHKVQAFLNILILLSLVIYAISGYLNKLIPFKYQLIILLIIIVMALIGILIRKVWLKLIVLLLVGGLSFAHIFVQDQIKIIVKDYVKNSDAAKEEAKQTISLVVLKQNQKWNGADLSDKAFGESDQLDLESKFFVQESLASIISELPEVVILETNQESYEKLIEREIDVMIMDEKYRKSMIEEYPEFEENTSVLTQFTRDRTVKSIQANPLSDSFIIYLSGNDSYGSIEELSRSDVNILMIFNPKLEKVLFISIPRDSYVSVPCVGGYYDKFTHTGNFGMNCQIETIEELFNISINYYLRINFSSVTRIIDIMGDGVTLYNPYGFEGGAEEYYFSKGCLHLSSGQVLSYLRTRHSLPNGDEGRQEHQKIVLNALIKKAIDPSMLFRAGEIIKTASENIDTNVDVDFINQFINRQLDTNPKWKVHTLSIDGFYSERPTYSLGDTLLSVFEPYSDSLSSLRTSIAQFMQASEVSQVEFLNESATVVSNEASDADESPAPVGPVENGTDAEASPESENIEDNYGIEWTSAPIIYPIPGGENSCNIR